MFFSSGINKKPTNLLKQGQNRKKSYKNPSKQYQDLERCEFKVIPSPTKFSQSITFYYLYGDICLAQRNDKIYSDISFLTRFKEFRSIDVVNNSKTKLVQVTLDPKENVQSMSWRKIVFQLELSGSPVLHDWAQTIKRYCTAYEDFIERRKIKTIPKEEFEEKKELNGIKEEAEKKKDYLISSYPCIYIKSQYNHEYGIQMKEISFNSQLLAELGHSQESFVTKVFQEGIPQVLSNNIEADSKAIKMLLDNYFALDKNDLATPDFEYLLLMKTDYTKRVLVQTNFLMNYEEGKFGIDIIYVIKPISEAFLNDKIIPKKILKEEYLQERRRQEHLQANFLSLYYNTSFDLRYTHLDKVCKIRELPLIKEEYYYYEK